MLVDQSLPANLGPLLLLFGHPTKAPRMVPPMGDIRASLSPRRRAPPTGSRFPPRLVPLTLRLTVPARCGTGVANATLEKAAGLLPTPPRSMVPDLPRHPQLPTWLGLPPVPGTPQCPLACGPAVRDFVMHGPAFSGLSYRDAWMYAAPLLTPFFSVGVCSCSCSTPTLLGISSSWCSPWQYLSWC